MHVPKRVLLFIFNLRIEKKGIIIYTANYACYIIKLFFLRSVAGSLYILEQLNVVSTAANESVLASIPKQTDSHMPQPHGLGRV